ncbi:hypothetical protein BU15DRAFT_65711 [Melanogaster broomeanus]|nr:hypothetical protein BU15DRAFT_65711 [Melanogaster broomeanus]
MPAKITVPTSIRNLLQVVKWLRAVVAATVLRPLVRVLVILLRHGRSISKVAHSCFNSWLTRFPTRIEPSITYVAPSTLPLPSSEDRTQGQPHPGPSETPAIIQHPPPGSIRAAATPSLRPIAPGEISRLKQRKLRNKTSNDVKIRAGKLDYSHNELQGWERTVHPGGRCYFSNADKSVFTDVELSQPRNLEDVEECIDLLRDKAREIGVLTSTPRQFQLVIQLIETDGFRQWCYYFVNHGCNVVFWVHDYNATNLLADLQGVVMDSHRDFWEAGCAIEMQYWLHCELFPNCIDVSQDHIAEVWGILSHAYTDRWFSIIQDAAHCEEIMHNYA